jgi:NADH-quinone oxidoreductase subunit D
VAELRNLTMNFGPQHPAAHGVLRLVLEMDGEVIQKADPHIAMLHGHEEAGRVETLQPVDQLHGPARLCFMMCSEHAYVLAIRSAGDQGRCRAADIRVMFDEITRILNHLMARGPTGSTSAP